MRKQLAVMLWTGLVSLSGSEACRADDLTDLGFGQRPAPYQGAQPDNAQESIYAPPEIADGRGGFNEGALSIEISGRYMTDYIFRGMELLEPQTSEDSFNFQLDAYLRLDLGRLPDPFFRLLTNTAEGDDISNFQVIRPALGLEWETESLFIAVGTQSFTYPDRTELDTGEIFADLRFNDGIFVAEEEPILGPFIFAAYDIDRFEGFYVEAGLRRHFEIGDTNFSVMVEGLVAYVDDFSLFSASPQNIGTGFSHYQVGVIGEYRLNSLLNISRRYGQWSLAGHLFYTDGIDNQLAATTQIWGGGGITFRY